MTNADLIYNRSNYLDFLKYDVSFQKEAVFCLFVRLVVQTSLMRQVDLRKSEKLTHKTRYEKVCVASRNIGQYNSQCYFFSLLFFFITLPAVRISLLF